MIAIISGASSGIGREFAYQVDDMGFDEIWIIARRTERLSEIKEAIKTPAKVLALDLLEEKSFDIIASELDASGKTIGLLVNSAGVGYNDYFSKNTMVELDRMIDLNIKAMTKLTKITLDHMEEDSVIINVSSVAAFIPQPKFASYAASKSYVLSLSRALNRELRDRKIHVTALCPNPVDTEFGETHSSGIKKYGTEDIKKLVARAIRNSKNTDLITTHPTSKLMLIVGKIIPHSFVMWVEKILGMY